MKTLKFRPNDGYPLSFRRNMGFHTGKYKWHTRHWYPDHVLRVGGHLHYLADHAPKPIRKKWKTAFRKFIQRHRKF